MTQAMEQTVHGEQTELGHAVGSLAHRAFHGDRHVADPGSLVSREREHVGGRVDAEKACVEALQLRVAVRRTDRLARGGTSRRSPQARSNDPRRASAATRRCRGLRHESRMTFTRMGADASGALDATLPRCKQLSLAAHGRLLVVLASANLGEDAVLLDLLVEPS